MLKQRHHNVAKTVVITIEKQVYFLKFNLG